MESLLGFGVVKMLIADGQAIAERHALSLGHELSRFCGIASFEGKSDTWRRAECIRCNMTFDVRWSAEVDQRWCVARKVNSADRWAKPMKFGELPPTCDAALPDQSQGIWTFGLEKAAA
jgi:hypothetical protein